MLKALLNPFGIALLIATLVLVGLVSSVLDRWSGQAIWIFLIGLIAYTSSAAVIYLQPSEDEQRNRTGESEKQEENLESELDNVPDMVFASESDFDPNSAPKPDAEDTYRITQSALQRINRLPALSRCDLITLIPRTLSSISLNPGEESSHDNRTPLEKAQVLHDVLIASIEKLRLPDETTRASADSALGYRILREFYVEDKLVAYLLTRYHVSEATYHRHRHEAISAISRDLETHEASLS